MIRLSRKSDEKVELEIVSDAIDFVIAEHEKRITDGYPIILDLSHDSHGHFGVGVGVTDRVFISHTPVSLDPPYHRSVGNLKSDHCVTYLYFGSPTEVKTDNLVSAEYIEPVLNEFNSKGTLSACISWEQV